MSLQIIPSQAMPSSKDAISKNILLTVDDSVAGSCEEALEILKGFQPACCLVNHQLPADNGLEFLKTVRRL
ncbi:MAG: CheY-like chemotaxis protein [Cellvibrionaceae bacterium]|jgi:CheY-like chemotaxis protein